MNTFKLEVNDWTFYIDSDDKEHAIRNVKNELKKMLEMDGYTYLSSKAINDIDNNNFKINDSSVFIIPYTMNTKEYFKKMIYEYIDNNIPTITISPIIKAMIDEVSENMEQGIILFNGSLPKNNIEHLYCMVVSLQQMSNVYKTFIDSLNNIISYDNITVNYRGVEIKIK